MGKMNLSLTLLKFFQLPSFAKRGGGDFLVEPLPRPPLKKGRGK